MPKPSDFFATHPVFRFDEFFEAHQATGARPTTTPAVLRYHVKTGRLTNLRRGLYSTDPNPDLFIVASRLTRDAVLAYDGALTFHGLHPLLNSISYLTGERASEFVYDQIYVQPIRPPHALAKKPAWGGKILTVEHAGQKLRVTSRERTLVDLLDRLDRGPGPRALFDAFRKGPLDWAQLIDHAKKLQSRIVVGRLAFFLHSLGAKNEILDQLDAWAPRSPIYFDPKDPRKGSEMLPRWNVLVSRRLMEHVNGPPSRDPVRDFLDDSRRYGR